MLRIFFLLRLLPTIFFPVIIDITTSCSRGLLERVQKQEIYNAVDLYW